MVLETKKGPFHSPIEQQWKLCSEIGRNVETGELMARIWDTSQCDGHFLCYAFASCRISAERSR